MGKIIFKKKNAFITLLDEVAGKIFIAEKKNIPTLLVAFYSLKHDLLTMIHLLKFIRLF